jgi:RND family efflux transporter MFP subunit
VLKLTLLIALFMNIHVQKMLGDAKDIRIQGWKWFKEQPTWRQWAEGAAFAALIVVIVSLGNTDAVATEAVQGTKAVTVAPVSELANTDTSLPLLGTVTSTSEATVRSESSGKLTRVYKKLGDYVTAGQVIAEFENSAERASLLQAEGVYDSAKAARDIAKINAGTTNTSLAESKNSALTALGSAYISVDDVIRVKTDSAYTDPRTQNVKFNVLVPDSMFVLSLESKRRTIEKILTDRSARNRTLTTESDLVAELNTVQTEVQTIKTYLDDLATAYSKALPDSNFSQAAIDANKANVSASRSIISGVLSSITNARTSLTSAVAATEVAGKTSGSSSSTTATADASVKQALGAYNAALSRLEKTVIRSPISGTLNSLTIKTGDFISAFTEVAVVSNNGALEVLAYVTEDDAKRVSVGSEVLIDGTAKGVVTRIASAIDPRTKKIEVRIGITSKNSSLVNGQSVRIAVTKDKQKITTTSGPLTIPLSALKLTPSGAYVFTVSATSSLVTIPVKEGAILGDEIQILSGLTGTETIVTDARGLKAGMTVTVKE